MKDAMADPRRAAGTVLRGLRRPGVPLQRNGAEAGGTGTPAHGPSLPARGRRAGRASCPAGTYSITGYSITLADSWRVNGIFNYPTVLDVVISHRQPSIFARMLGFSTLTTAASARATIPGPQFNGAAYAVAASTALS